MTRIQRGWAIAAILAGGLLACIVALSYDGSVPLAPAIALALLVFALLIVAARQARRP